MNQYSRVVQCCGPVASVNMAVYGQIYRHYSPGTIWTVTARYENRSAWISLS